MLWWPINRSCGTVFTSLDRVKKALYSSFETWLNGGTQAQLPLWQILWMGLRASLSCCQMWSPRCSLSVLQHELPSIHFTPKAFTGGTENPNSVQRLNWAVNKWVCASTWFNAESSCSLSPQNEAEQNPHLAILHYCVPRETTSPTNSQFHTCTVPPGCSLQQSERRLQMECSMYELCLTGNHLRKCLNQSISWIPLEYLQYGILWRNWPF